MSAVLLDTSAYSHAMRGHRALVQLLRTVDEIHVSAIVIGELRAGFRRGSRRTKNESNLTTFLSSPRVVRFSVDEETADCYAAVLDSLRAAGTPITTNDVWISATAMQHGHRLVTTDRDFLHVRQIRVELFDPS